MLRGASTEEVYQIPLTSTCVLYSHFGLKSTVFGVKYIMDPTIVNQYHYRLNLPIAFEPVYLEPNPSQHNIYSIDLIPKDFKDFLAGLKINIMFGEQFLLDPNKRATYYAHIDDPTAIDHVKMNYVYCDDPHTMNWYRLKDGKQSTLATTTIGTSYSWAEKHDCDIVYSASVGTPSIVNVTVLHDVSPVTAIRYCFSLTLSHLDNPSKKLTWAEAEVLLKDYIVAG